MAAHAGTVRPTLRKLRILTSIPMEWEHRGAVACNGVHIRVHLARIGEQVVYLRKGYDMTGVEGRGRH